MKREIMGSVAALLTGAGLACGQASNGGKGSADTLPPPALLTAASPAAVLPALEPAKSNLASRTALSPYLLTGALDAPPAAPPPEPAAPSVNCSSCASDDYAASIWVNVEYLLWWIKNGPLPTPLVTTSSTAAQGVLGKGDTAILLGGNDIDYHAFSGGRFTLGLWHTDGQTVGMEASGFFLEKRPSTSAFGSTLTGSPLVARPIINAATGAETALLVSTPGTFAGDVEFRSTTSLYGWDLNAIANLVRNCRLDVDVLAGFRFQHLEEDIDLLQRTTVLAEQGTFGFAQAAVLPPSSIGLFDCFTTRNEFYGGQIGARGEYGNGNFFVHFIGKLAIGATHQVGIIDGASSLHQPGKPTLVVPGGLLALSTNSGRLANDEFSVIPELGINLGYQVCHCLRAYVGYSVIYWSDVARPGDLINRTVNPALVPTSKEFGTALAPVQPLSSFHNADFWAQGVNFGLEFRY